MSEQQHDQQHESLQQPAVEINVEKLEGHKVKMEVTVAPGEVARAYDRAYRYLVNRANVPGFRRGKVPRPVLERHLGPGALRQEALELALNEAYPQALDAKRLDPIDHPELEVVTFEEGQPFVFKATVEVRPDVELAPYTGMNLALEPKPVTEADVEAQLDSIRERQAELVPAEPDTVLADGLYGVIDYEGTIDGKPFSGGKVDGALVRMGAGQLEPELEAAVKGAKAGEEREVKVTFPSDLPNPELQGKEAVFKLRVKEVKRKKLPELTDDLAKEITGLDVAALRERLEKSLKDRAVSEAREELSHTIVERVTAEAKVDVPETLIKRRMERMRSDTEERLQKQNLSLDQYLQIVGLDREKWDKDLRTRAEHAVKRDLVLGEVARREKIEATEPEVEFEIARMAAYYQEKPERIRSLFRDSPDRLDALKAGIITDKTVQYLVRMNMAAAPEAAAPEPESKAAPEAAAAGPAEEKPE